MYITQNIDEFEEKGEEKNLHETSGHWQKENKTKNWSQSTTVDIDMLQNVTMIQSTVRTWHILRKS